VKIFNPLSPNDLYTLEYRQGDGWDQGISKNVVVVHEDKSGSSPWSFLQEGPSVPPGGNSGGFAQGDLYTNRNAHLIMSVQSIDPVSGTATVNVTTYQGESPQL
jgi:hypothetical protein